MLARWFRRATVGWRWWSEDGSTMGRWRCRGDDGDMVVVVKQLRWCVGSGDVMEHNIVHDTFVNICFRFAISIGKEVDIGLSGGRDKLLRPADMLLYSWDGGFDVCVYLTGSSPLTQTRMVDFVLGRAVIEAAQRKRVKYEAKCADIGYGFLSFSFSSFRELEQDADKGQQMGGVREKAHAIGGGILHAVVSALMNMDRVFKTRLRRRRVKQSGEIDIEFKMVEEYMVIVVKMKWGGEGDAVMLARWFRHAAVRVEMVERRWWRRGVVVCGVMGMKVMMQSDDRSGGKKKGSEGGSTMVMLRCRGEDDDMVVVVRRLRWCVGGGDVMEVVAAWSGGAWRDGDEGDDGEWRPERWSKKKVAVVEVVGIRPKAAPVAGKHKNVLGKAEKLSGMSFYIKLL
nr:hypothetical protein [Tanacetum cinerariifolium]